MITLAPKLFRMISFSAAMPGIVPDHQIEEAAAQTFVARSQIDPTPLLRGCTLCDQEDVYTPVENAYVSFCGEIINENLSLVIAFTLLCNKHAHENVRPTIQFHTTGYEVSAYEMQMLQDYVNSEQRMPDVLWVVEISFGAQSSEDIARELIDASHV